jgi:ribosomal protein L12E/L44/L45/RPP1/RPP2
MMTAMRALGISLLLLSLLTTACAEDDEDRIDTFVAAVTGKVDARAIDHVLATYVDVATENLDVRAFGDSRMYRAEDAERFEKEARARLEHIEGRSLNAVRRRIRIEGETARVELQFLGRDAMGSVRYELRKHGTRWLIGSVYVTR